MKLFITSNSQQRVLYLLVFIAILFYVKPSLLFVPSGKPREYGVGFDEEGYKKTLYNVQFVIFVAALLLVYYA
jgi:hypothetical protein